MEEELRRLIEEGKRHSEDMRRASEDLKTLTRTLQADQAMQQRQINEIIRRLSDG